MDSSGQFRSIPIPSELYASDTNEPMAHCLMCSTYLLEPGTPYMLEKSIKQHPEMGVKEVIFEYAMCMDCAVKMNDSLSVESRQRIEEYFTQHAHLAERAIELMSEQPDSFSSWVEHCVIKGTPISKATEYQLVVQCNGPDLLFTYMPFALSFEAMEEMTSLMSAKSLGEMDDFIGRYFTGPPEVAELLRKKFVLI